MKQIVLASFLALLIVKGYTQRIAADTFQIQKGTLVVQPIQHASVVLSIKGATIYADPTGGAAKYTGLAAPDIILVTDIHGDHFDSATIAAVKTANTIIVAPQVVVDKLSAADKVKAVVLKNGENTKQAGISIDAIPMYNLPADAPNSRHPKGRGNGYVVHLGGKNVYLSGDTEGIPEMRSLKNIDIAFVCMNLPYTMDVNHAAEAVLAFVPKVVYPYHYRGQDTNAFKTLVDAGNKSIEVRLRDWYAK